MEALKCTEIKYYTLVVVVVKQYGGVVLAAVALAVAQESVRSPVWNV